MRGNCAEVGGCMSLQVSWRHSRVWPFHVMYFELRHNWVKNQQLAADSQQTQMQEWKLEEHQTEQPRPNKGHKVNTPHPRLILSLVDTVHWSSLLMIFHFVHTTPEWLLKYNLQWSSLWMSNRDSGMSDSTWMRVVSPHSFCHLSNVRATGSFWEWAHELYAGG